jgi:glucose/arabinose dehydrogenase
VRRARALALVAALIAGGCGGDSGAPEPTDTTSRSPAAGPSGPPALEELVRLDEPVAVIAHAGSLLFAEKKGRVIEVAGEDVRPILDISGQVSLANEQGLLGLAIHPDGGFLYLNLTNRDGDTEIREYPLDGSDVDASGERLVLRIDQPAANHNGGHLAFGPDGYLYIGTGDGGGAGDTFGNARNLGSLLGKMLRIDPRPNGDASYRPAPGNPFAGRAGARPEIWAFGLRNPWRYTFSGGHLWIADVGQGEWEEINRVPTSRAGADFGWNLREGTHQFRGDRPEGAVDPVHEYDHSGGRCSVTGGVVHPGDVGSSLAGAYLFADHCDGRVHAIHPDGDVEDLGLTVDQPTSFGLDGDGSVLVLSRSGPVYRLTGGRT